MKTIRSFIVSLLGVVSLTLFSAVPVFAADAETPSDVENLKAQAYNQAASLTWNSATDNVGIEGYQLHYGTTSVTEPGQEYDENIDVGDVQEYVVTGLTNGTTYYFSVIAYDAAGNESKAWAPEKSATPSEDKGDYSDAIAPKVMSAESSYNTEVKVVFSEAVSIPEEDPQDAFQIEDDDNFEPLDVLSAVMDEDDESNKTVILTTAEQTAGSTYKITVGVEVEDKSGNPINSGTSDTALFEGSGEEKPAEDIEGPKVLSVKSLDNTNIVVNFNESVVLGIDPSEHFTIAQENDATKTLTVLAVELSKNEAGTEDSAVLIKTSPQDKVNYILTVVKLPDEAGNQVVATHSSAMFEGIADSEVSDDDNDDDSTEDKAAPKDVIEFIAKSVEDAGKYIISLTWKNPAENAGDTTEQIIYLSNDKGAKYEKKSSIDPQAEKYDLKDIESGEYWVKLTQKDAAGNESEGVIAKIALAETGPEMLGLLLVSLGLGRIVSRRKK
jgi:hypothetical protein